MKRIFVSILIIVTGIIQAQKEQDSVKTEVINVTRSFEPKVQDAYKLDVNPEINQISERKIPVEYHIQSVPVASTFQPEKGAMAGFNAGSIQEDVYKSYAAIAGGNYLQIQGDAYIFYPVTERLGSALSLSHYSSQGSDTIYKPFYHTSIDALFDYKGDNSRWNFDLGYNGHINHINEFPFTPSGSLIDQVTDKHTENNLIFDLSGTFKDLFIKDLNLHYNNYWDGFDNSEHAIQLKGNLKFPVGNIDLRMGIQTDLVNGDLGRNKYFNPAEKNEITYNNFDLGILPGIQIENDNLVVNIGAKIFYQTPDNLYKNIQFFPDLNLNFNLIYEKLTLFAGVTGDIMQNAHYKLAAENPYLFADNPIIPTLIPYDIFGGFKGAFSTSFSYEVNLGFRRINNYAFYNFIPDRSLAGYKLIYDDMSQSYFKTAFNIGIGKKFDLKMQLTYLQNDPDNLKKALHIPDFRFKSILIFKPSDKLNFSATLNSTGNRNFSTNYDDALPGYTDLNFGVCYNINKQFTAFLQANNLLNKTYEIYYLYPVQKLQILGGVAYRFDIPVQK
jgi:hypothetical protein